MTTLQNVMIAAFLLLYATPNTSTLKGNHRRLGEQREPSVHIDEIDADSVPQPEDFYNRYVKENRPLVFRGAARKSRAFKLWTEDFLIDSYGNLTVRLEAKFENNRILPEGAVSLGLDLLGNFLRNYQMQDSYIISQIPVPMEKDVMILPCLRCGSFAKSVQEVHVFLSASGGKTALHKDPYNNIHCVFNGTKDWILIHPNYTDFIYMETSSEFEWGGISSINADSVDLHRYPKVLDIEYAKLRLHKGDCIFMPSGYWHQVRSFGYMNSAVAIWFSVLDHFDSTGCKDREFDYTLMNETDILWRYSGYGNLSQGHMDIYILQKALIKWADAHGVIPLQSFANFVFVLLDSNAKRAAMVADMKRRKKEFLEYLDPDKDGYATKELVASLSIKQLKDLVELVHPNDISNTDLLEYGHLPVDDIR
eukprot:gene13699-4609_t